MKIMNSKPKTGFTLVELLVVIAIVGVLIGLLIPAVQSVRESSRRVACANNQRQLILAIHSFESANDQIPETLSLDPNLKLTHWHTALLPFLDQRTIFQEVKDELGNKVHVFQQKHFTTTINVFQCPSEPNIGKVIESEETGFQFAFTNYCGVNGIKNEDSNGVFPTNLQILSPIKFSKVSDGLSNTLAFGERPPSEFQQGFGMWLGSQNAWAASVGVNEGIVGECENEMKFQAPNPLDTDPCRVYQHWGHHPLGINFARVDGSVHFTSYEIESMVLSSLATRSKGD